MATTTVLCSRWFFVVIAAQPNSALVNVDPAAGSVRGLQRIVPQIQQRWPKTQIIVRSDGAYYARTRWLDCEEHNVDYVWDSPVINGSSAWPMSWKAKAEFRTLSNRCAPLRPTPWFRSLSYRTLDSWSRYRRVVCKLTYDADGAKRRFVVTSLPAHQVIPSSLTWLLLSRGDMENRLKGTPVGPIQWSHLGSCLRC